MWKQGYECIIDLTLQDGTEVKKWKPPHNAYLSDHICIRRLYVNFRPYENYKSFRNPRHRDWEKFRTIMDTDSLSNDSIDTIELFEAKIISLIG